MECELPFRNRAAFKNIALQVKLRRDEEKMIELGGGVCSCFCGFTFSLLSHTLSLWGLKSVILRAENGSI